MYIDISHLMQYMSLTSQLLGDQNPTRSERCGSGIWWEAGDGDVFVGRDAGVMVAVGGKKHPEGAGKIIDDLR